jgi:hypothetical protein
LALQMPLTARERATVACLIDWAVAPTPPLPAVEAVDAVAALGRYLEATPPVSRIAFRATLAVLERLPLLSGERRRLSSLSPASRVHALRRLEQGRLATLGQALAALAQLCYYGDATVAGALGYDSTAVVARGKALRAAQVRW